VKISGKIEFTKAVATGNDFVIVEGRAIGSGKIFSEYAWLSLQYKDI